MNDLYLIATISGQRVAISAAAVESVVEIEAITPVPLAAAHVAGLAALRSRVLTIIDSFAALEIGRFPSRDVIEAIVVTVDGHLYGLLVDQVDDVIEVTDPPAPLRGGLAPGWARCARGLIGSVGESALVVDPEALVAGPSAAVAA